MSIKKNRSRPAATLPDGQYYSVGQVAQDETQKYMVTYTETYIYGTDEYGEKIIKHFPMEYEYFQYLSDARIFVNNLPETVVNVKIYELFEVYPDEE